MTPGFPCRPGTPLLMRRTPFLSVRPVPEKSLRNNESANWSMCQALSTGSLNLWQPMDLLICPLPMPIPCVQAPTPCNTATRLTACLLPKVNWKTSLLSLWTPLFPIFIALRSGRLEMPLDDADLAFLSRRARLIRWWPLAGITALVIVLWAYSPVCSSSNPFWPIPWSSLPD